MTLLQKVEAVKNRKLYNQKLLVHWSSIYDNALF